MQRVIRRNTKGFTLIELTVVLMVLIALAGIMVPMLTGYVSRSHTSAASTNFGEITKNIQLYNVKYLQGYPTGYDSVVDASGNLPTLKSNGNNTMEWQVNNTWGANPITPLTLTATQQQSLANNGITTVFTQNNPIDDVNGQSATFDGANYGAGATVIGTGTILAQLDPTNATAQTVLNKSFGIFPPATPTETYVVLGIGHGCSAVGKTMVDAPLHFDQVDPQQVYSRFFVVYAVPPSSASGAPAFSARFVGVVGAELSGLGDHLHDYYTKDSQ